MNKIKLYKHQTEALDTTADKNRVAYFHDMGLGKTFTGAEKMHRLGGRVNLVICQKSKIDDWCRHFQDNYYSGGADQNIILPHNLTEQDGMTVFKWNIETSGGCQLVGIINHDLIFRRPELLKIKFDTILLDESSMIKNDTAKRRDGCLAQFVPIQKLKNRGNGAVRKENTAIVETGNRGDQMLFICGIGKNRQDKVLRRPFHHGADDAEQKN